MGEKKEKPTNPIEMVSGKKESEECGNSWLGNMAETTQKGDAEKAEQKKSIGFQEINHPPIGKLMDHAERFDTRMHNKFLKQLYLKYPSILPKDLPKDDFEFGINVKFKGVRSDITSYRCDYGDMKEEQTPDLYRAAGLHRKEAAEEEEPPNPLYYQSGGRHPISAIKEPSKRMPPVKDVTQSEVPEIPIKIRTEYDHNFNGLAKYFHKKHIYTEPFVYVTTLCTLPK